MKNESTTALTSTGKQTASPMASSRLSLAFKVDGGKNEMSDVEALLYGLIEQRYEQTEQLVMAVGHKDYVAAGKRLSEIRSLDGLLIELGLGLCEIASNSARVIKRMETPSGKTDAELDQEEDAVYANSIKELLSFNPDDE